MRQSGNTSTGWCRRAALASWRLVALALFAALVFNATSFRSDATEKAPPLLSAKRIKPTTIPSPSSTAQPIPNPSPSRSPGPAKQARPAPKLPKPLARPRKVPQRPTDLRNCEAAIYRIEAYGAWRHDALQAIDAMDAGPDADTPFPSKTLPDGSPLSIMAFSRIGGGGWGDRIPGMLATFLFALRYQRVFIADYPALGDWLESPLLDLDLDPAAQHPYLNWAVRATPPKLMYGCGEDCMWALEEPEVSAFPPSEAVHHVVVNKGLWAHTARDSHVRWANASGLYPHCMHQLLLRPTQALLAAAEPNLARLRALRSPSSPVKRLVGFHYHARHEGGNAGGDGLTYHDLDADFKSTLTACLSEEDVAVLLVTDSTGLKRDLAQRFGDKRVLLVEYPSSNDENNSKEGASGGLSLPSGARFGDEEIRSARVDDREALRDVLIDWWLLASATDHIVLAASSGLARSAVAASAHGAFTLAGAAHCRPQYQGHSHEGYAALIKAGNSGF